jgi:glycosyltransferase involved in cell wall biosynthesis
MRFYWRKIGIEKKTIDSIDTYNFFFPLPYRFFPRKIRNFFINRFSSYLLSFVLRKEGAFDVIHAHYLQNIRVASVLKEKIGAPLVGTEHWSELKRVKIKNCVFKDAEETYPKVERLISVSRTLKNIIYENFNVDSNIVGCVIDDVFEYRKKIRGDDFKFLSVGSLLNIKGFDCAIEAFSEAKFERDVQYHIVGSGPEMNRLSKIILERGLSKSVFLHGQKSRYEIMNIMSQSSAYILSSRSENFATACMEALSAGLPALMTACGGPEDFVSDKNSIIVPVDDTKRMAIGMREMVESIDRFDRESISLEMKTKYSSQAVASLLSKEYMSAINWSKV